MGKYYYFLAITTWSIIDRPFLTAWRQSTIIPTSTARKRCGLGRLRRVQPYHPPAKSWWMHCRGWSCPQPRCERRSSCPPESRSIVLYSLIGILLQFLSLTMAILEASELLFGYNRNTFVLNVQCNG